MTPERKKKVVMDALKQWSPYALFGIFISAFTLGIFALYNLDLEPFIYVTIVGTFFLIILLVVLLNRSIREAKKRDRLLEMIQTEHRIVSDEKDLKSTDYEKMIGLLGEEIDRLSESIRRERSESEDFYTTWVHQIKTPIAVLKMSLGSAETPDKNIFKNELFRIEEYTDMVLTYLRLQSDTTDLLIREYHLDDLIRESIRKFAPQFIYKKIKMNYAGTDFILITDKKWFLCMLDQILSNSIKYTKEGSVTILVQEGKIFVSDTGIGIAREDIPRIFERGYTGLNGRQNEKSSGLGLYLCKKAGALLKIPIRVESEVRVGTTFILDIHERTGRVI